MKIKRSIAALLAGMAMLLLLGGCGGTTPPVQTPAGVPPVETPAATVPMAQTPAPGVSAPASSGFEALSLEENTTFDADIDGDGILEALTITTETDEEGVSVAFLAVNKNGTEQKTVLMESVLFYSAYFLKPLEEGGEAALLTSFSYEDGLWCTALYRFENAAPVEAVFISGGVASLENDRAVLLDVLDAVGTWDVERVYIVSLAPSLSLTPDQSVEIEIYGCARELTVLKPLPVTLDDGAAVMLDVGEKLWLYASDGASYVRFTLEDGRTGKLNYKMVGGFATLVDGTNDNEWLDGIIYSG